MGSVVPQGGVTQDLPGLDVVSQVAQQYGVPLGPELNAAQKMWLANVPAIKASADRLRLNERYLAEAQQNVRTAAGNVAGSAQGQAGTALAMSHAESMALLDTNVQALGSVIDVLDETAAEIQATREAVSMLTSSTALYLRQTIAPAQSPFGNAAATYTAQITNLLLGWRTSVDTMVQQAQQRARDRQATLAATQHRLLQSATGSSGTPPATVAAEQQFATDAINAEQYANAYSVPNGSLPPVGQQTNVLSQTTT